MQFAYIYSDNTFRYLIALFQNAINVPVLNTLFEF